MIKLEQTERKRKKHRAKKGNKPARINKFNGRIVKRLANKLGVLNFEMKPIDDVEGFVTELVDRLILRDALGVFVDFLEARESKKF